MEHLTDQLLQAGPLGIVAFLVLFLMRHEVIQILRGTPTKEAKTSLILLQENLDQNFSELKDQSALLGLILSELKTANTLLQNLLVEQVRRNS